MHVVNIGLDPKTLDPESVVAFRNRAYGTLTDHYSIVVPSPVTVTVHLSDKTTVYGIGGWNKPLKLFGMFRKVRSLIRRGMCNVVTTQDMYFLGLLGVYFSQRYHLGFEVQVLGIEKLTPTRKMIARFVFRRAGLIRALSSRIQTRLIHEFDVPKDKIVITSIYVDVRKLGLDIRTLTGEALRSYESFTSSFREQYAESFNFLTVSRLVPIKRIEMQLEALRVLREAHPHALLHIVGNGPHEHVLRKKVTSLGLEQNVVFHGYQSGYILGALYLECDCFVLTSDYEGWGMVVIEAASAGLPIIMTDVGCAGEFIIHEESGVIIPIHNHVALVTAMKRIIEDAQFREVLTTNATKALSKLPSFETLLAEYKRNWEVALERAI